MIVSIRKFLVELLSSKGKRFWRKASRTTSQVMGGVPETSLKLGCKEVTHFMKSIPIV
jgi:hypothetical protein